jgi:hypothetical protein
MTNANKIYSKTVINDVFDLQDLEQDNNGKYDFMDSDSNYSVDSDSSNFSIDDTSINSVVVEGVTQATVGTATVGTATVGTATVGTAIQSDEEELEPSYMSYCRNCYKKIKNNIRKRFTKKGVPPFETPV